MDYHAMKQLVLTADKQQDGEVIRTLLEVEQTEESYTRFPWNAQSINQTVLDLLVAAIAQKLGVELIEIDLIEIGAEIAVQQGIEFRRIEQPKDDEEG